MQQQSFFYIQGIDRETEREAWKHGSRSGEGNYACGLGRTLLTANSQIFAVLHKISSKSPAESRDGYVAFQSRLRHFESW
jgi:hypothetical protein